MASRVRTALIPLALVAFTAGAQAQQRREAGAHEHGHGKLNIVIDGGNIQFELDAPAHDILGFEHQPKTKEQQARLETAVAALKDAGRIYGLAADAGCTLSKAEAGLEQPEAGGSGHADFNATAVFSCTAIAKLRQIDLGLFKAFPDADKLDITIVGPKGQTTASATRKSARIDLGKVN
jgi:hypothetical protein